MKLNHSLIRQITNLVAIIAAFGINVLANLNPPKGMTIGDISNQLFGDVLITPANYAFAIWGLIYLGLISFAIYQALPSQRYNPTLVKLGWGLAIASGAQILWIFCFLYSQFALSFILMLGILIPLIFSYLRLPNKGLSQTERWLVTNPLSIYLAWISVATIVNGATVLDYWQWNGWGINPQIWTVIMIIVAGGIGVILATQNNIAFVGVYIWALLAIAVRNSATTIITITTVGIALILASILLVNKLKQNSILPRM
ncbi:MAG: tryptophan-rich sensory protein [Xenococcaceae cyanobacterium MO_167.B27]|nr:tryptophan-rich sensory protein [Xenococcaceae cyanobacterium MO_167.B27]